MQTIDAGVPEPVLMQSDEVAPVQRHDRAMLAGRELQHFAVRHGPTCMPPFPHGQHVVPQTAEFERHRLGQILVREKPRHDHAASCAAICPAISAGWR